MRGGIRASAQRHGKSWWTGRWLDVIEGFDIGARLSRGRSYARNGQVTKLSVEAGEARASVQGSRSGAYRVRIGMDVIPDKKWKELASILFEKPAAASSLLGGRMPEDAEKAFKSAGLDLFPRRESDLVTECTCPDWSNPCKHVNLISTRHMMDQEPPKTTPSRIHFANPNIFPNG